MTASEVENRNSKIETGNQAVEASQLSIANRQSSITLPLLLEVGCEEIPARFLHDAEKGLGERVRAALREARLLPHDVAPFEAGVGAIRESPVRTYSTPRRLVIHVPALLGRQPDKVEEILGPPVKVAVGAEGKYTRAAESFAQKNSARLEDLTRTTTPKGEYLALRKTTQGRSAQAILPEILPATILGLSFPKSMYWMEKSDPRFVRPIRWVLAVLGEGKQAETVDFEILGVKSGDSTFGHRAKSRKPQRVTGFKDYTKKLAQAHVEIDSARRLERVIQEARALVENASLKLVQDEWLVDWIVNSTEWPRPMLGSFDERFLHLPREILTTVMRDHQKYFAVEDQQGNLQPHFVAVLNMDSDEKGLIRQGHERVLTARFRDAEFFWNADQRIPLRDRLPLLEKVTYQAELGSYGSYGDKVRRMRALAEKVCREPAVQQALSRQEGDAVLRAVELCKCDLTTQMVHEFPELQGVVGGLYGAQFLEVANAIYDHYLPKSLEDRCPRSLVGAIVSFADKLDSVVAGFAAGLKPSGSRDPFGLRRHGNGIIKVLLEVMPPITFSNLVAFTSDLFNQSKPPVMELCGFFIERLAYYLGRKFRYDTVRAVLADPDHELDAFNVPAEALHRVRILEQFRDTEDFVAMAQAAKRVGNILTKSATEGKLQGASLDESLLEPGPEEQLWHKYLEGCKTLEVGGRFWSGGGYDYEKVFAYVATFRPFVDHFFDKVLVMTDDAAVRRNRLLLLVLLDQRILSKFVRLSEIVPGTPIVDASTSGRNEVKG
ncbi:MAG: glycine--tRNA ligase subunit beta [Terriglobia bacterium]|jgi:glycyl-tRNA synthetase beta chain